MVTSPSSGARTVDSMRMVVVLPAPLGPSRPKISCLRMPKETPSTAVSPPKDFRKLVAVRNSVASAVASIIAGMDVQWFQGTLRVSVGQW